jgi:hypothetical protein
MGSFNLDYFIHAANILLLAAYSVRDILWLRLFAVASSLAAIPYFLLQPPPLWATFGWSVLFTGINIIQAWRLLVERRPVKPCSRVVDRSAMSPFGGLDEHLSLPSRAPAGRTLDGLGVALSSVEGRRFHARHFSQPPQMTLGPTEFGTEKRLDEIPRHGRPDRPSAHAQDVEVVVLDALLRGEVVVNERRADACDLVGADRRAHAAAADRHAALYLSRDHGTRKRDDEVGIVVVRIERVGAEIHDLVPRSS